MGDEISLQSLKINGMLASLNGMSKDIDGGNVGSVIISKYYISFNMNWWDLTVYDSLIIGILWVYNNFFLKIFLSYVPRLLKLM